MPLVADSLVRGELVEVLPRHRLTSPMGYWMVTSARSKARPEIVAFTEWLLEQAEVANQNVSRFVKMK